MEQMKTCELCKTLSSVEEDEKRCLPCLRLDVAVQAAENAYHSLVMQTDVARGRMEALQSLRRDIAVLGEKVQR